MPLMKKYLCGLAVLLLLTNCQKGSEGDSPVAPFTINLSQKMITCFPKDVKIFDFNVTGPEATNLKLEVVITEPWKYKLLKFEPSADGGYNGTIEITAPSKKSEASNYSTIDITVLSETYSSCVSASLIVNPAPPLFTATNLETDFKVNELREITFSLKSEENVGAFAYQRMQDKWRFYVGHNSLYFIRNPDYSITSGKMTIQAPDKPSETDLILRFEGHRPYQAMQVTIHAETLHLKCNY